MKAKVVNDFLRMISADLADLDPVSLPDNFNSVHLETENYFVEICVFNFERIVVTFETAGLPMVRPDRYRQGWGAQVLKSRRVSYAAVKPKEVDWYTRPDLHVLLSRISKVLASFRTRIAYGASMGAYGALLHSKVIGVDRIVAISPQTTLNRQRIPQEIRFPEADRWDWDGPFGDVLDRLSSRSTIFIVYDPFDQAECAQINRMEGPNLNFIRIPFGGHRLPIVLKKANLLAKIFDLCLTGDIDLSGFYRQLRLCRMDRDRLVRIEKHLLNRPARLEIVRRALCLLEPKK